MALKPAVKQSIISCVIAPEERGITCGKVIPLANSHCGFAKNSGKHFSMTALVSGLFAKSPIVELMSSPVPVAVGAGVVGAAVGVGAGGVGGAGGGGGGRGVPGRG